MLEFIKLNIHICLYTNISATSIAESLKLHLKIKLKHVFIVWRGRYKETFIRNFKFPTLTDRRTGSDNMDFAVDAYEECRGEVLKKAGKKGCR